jgi:hypothetical protein
MGSHILEWISESIDALANLELTKAIVSSIDYGLKHSPIHTNLEFYLGYLFLGLVMLVVGYFLVGPPWTEELRSGRWPGYIGEGAFFSFALVLVYAIDQFLESISVLQMIDRYPGYCIFAFITIAIGVTIYSLLGAKIFAERKRWQLKQIVGLATLPREEFAKIQKSTARRLKLRLTTLNKSVIEMRHSVSIDVDFANLALNSAQDSEEEKRGIRRIAKLYNLSLDDAERCALMARTEIKRTITIRLLASLLARIIHEDRDAELADVA